MATFSIIYLAANKRSESVDNTLGTRETHNEKAYIVGIVISFSNHHSQWRHQGDRISLELHTEIIFKHRKKNPKKQEKKVVDMHRMSCNDFRCTYTGQTKRLTSTRVKEHYKGVELIERG